MLVSHSSALAAGVGELVLQMAPDVTVAAAGGLPDGGIGTDLERVQAALTEALLDAHVAVVLCDLGSAVMTAEMAVELLDEPTRALLVEGPFVEGALAAGVAAQSGAGVDEVVAAVRDAAGTTPASDEDQDIPQPAGRAQPRDADVGVAERTVVLRNPLGLHARPAAAVAALAGAAASGGTSLELGRVGGPLTDATALLRVVRLSLRGGDEVRVVARGPEAPAAIERLADLVSSGFGELDPSSGGPAPTPPGQGPPATRSPRHDGTRLTGTGASPGTAVASLLVLDEPSPDLPTGAAADLDAERRRSWAARERVAGAMSAVDPSTSGADVLAMHAVLLSDPDLEAAVSFRLEEGQPAATAWWLAAREVAATMTDSGDPLLAERATDVRDVALRVLDELGVSTAPPATDHVAGRIVVAEDVPPSWVPAMAAHGLAGLALAGSGTTSHAVVLARGLAVPCAVALGPSLLSLARAAPADRAVLLDGTAGTLTLAPAGDVVAAARETAAAEAAAAEQRRSAAQAVVTVRGRVVPVLANVTSATESAMARQEGADGIGLLRTELLLSDRPDLPTEDEQVEAIVAIAREQGARRVVVRTFDVGGDKPVAALGLDPVRHGFLGERGLRLFLARRDLLRVQLRAVLRAAAQVAESGTRLAVMAPMVTVADEVVTLRAELAAARTALRGEGRPAGDLDGLGVMVEVPAAALTVSELAPLVDFVSVGTNDLVQYVMAAERTNAAVAHLYRPDHPAVWRILELLVEGAHAGGCEVSVCGQMAADPELAVRLVGLGVDDLSVPPGDVGRIKAALQRA